MIQVAVPFSKSIRSSRSLTDTFTFLASQDTTEKYFPGLEKLTLIQGDIYEWLFSKLSYGGYEIAVHFKTTIKSSPPNFITIEPYEGGKDKTSLKARWEVKEGLATFSAELMIGIPVPSLMRSMAEPLAKKELSKLFDRYLQNVEKALI